MRFTLENKTTAGFGLALLFILTIGVVSWHSNDRHDRALESTRHTQEILTQLESLLANVTDGETGQRGFIITGAEGYLDPYRTFLASTDREYRRLLDLTADNPRQQTSLARLKPLLDEYAGVLHKNIELRRSLGFEVGVQAVASGRGKSLHDRIRLTIRDMQGVERGLLAQREAETAASAKITRISVAVGSLLVVSIILIALVVTRRDFKRLRAAETALREREESLDITLHSIGDAVLVTDTDGRIGRMNPVAERLTGWPSAEALGRPVGEVFRIINEVTRQPAPIPVEDVLRTGEIHGLANHTVLIARDGTECAIADSAAPIHDAEGTLRGVVLVFRDVSQERVAELALQASESRYRQFIEQSPFGVFVQCEGRFAFLNPKAVALLGGHSESDLLGRQVPDSLHPDDRATVRERIRLLNEAHVAVPALEAKWLRLDGSVFHGETTAVPHEHAGQSGALVILQDITARKEAEEQLDRFFTLSLDMLCISSSDGHFKRVSPAFSQTLGWSTEEILARPFLDFVHPDDQTATLREVERQVSAGESVLHFENRYRHKDGSWRVLSWKSVPQTGGLMYATARDVTRQHEVAEEMRQLNADLERRMEERAAALDALNNREEEIRALVDNLLDCVITIDAQGTVHSANPALERILGFAAEEIIGRNVSMLMPEPHRSGHDAYLEHYLRTGEARIIGIGREVEGRRKDDRLIPLELVVSEYVVHGERRFIGTLRDISERKQFIAELTQARAEAEQASRAKSAFLATMSHEIRTPMNGVIGMVDVLAHSRLSAHQTDLVTTIRESATALLGIIDDILDFSKIEAGRLEIEQAPLSVADLVEGICNSLVPVATRRGVDLSLFIAPAVPERVLSDDVRLRQVLYNLVGNAIKFSGGRPDKRGRVSIRAEVVETAPLRLAFRIADNGIGIATETQHGLFTPFTQAEVSTTRRFGGTGLGLAICKRLVDLMGGEITVESIPGVGSTFTVTLPFDLAAEQPARILPDISGVDCIVINSQDINIDDLNAYLEHAGARLHLVVDMAAALRAASVLATPVVVDHDAGHKRTAIDELFTSGIETPNIHFLLITRGRRRRARIEGPEVVTLDGNALRRQALLRAVAVAAGRSSPDIVHTSAGEDLPDGDLAAPTIAEARAQGRLILVAEDDDINQKVILQQLGLLGYAAEVAGNGKKALRLWREGSFALLLTDLHMPEMDGYTLAETIRREETGQARMPILALTANALRGEANRAKAAGMDEYLTKPVQLRLLRAALEKWLPHTETALPPVPPSESNRSGQTAHAVDVAVLKGLVGDDPETVSEFLTDYLASARRLAADLRMAFASGDARHVGAIAHKLKSSSRSVGALALGDLCAELENEGKAEDKASIEQSMNSFEAALAEVEACIDKILAD